MRKARRDQDLQRQARAALDRSKREDKRLIDDVLGDDEEKSESIAVIIEELTDKNQAMRISSRRWGSSTLR